MKRADDFQERRKHLANLSEEELDNRFWELSEKIIDPIIDLAYKNTTPSIERSILLRMGFSSIEAGSLVENTMDRNLLKKGVGNLVYRLAKEKNLDIRQAGISLIDGENWDYVSEMFKAGDK